MTAIAHRWILASAGTGKTYQLSGRFLALLFAGVPPERILATTFTRKAAGEILDRVLRRLVEAIASADKLRELNAQLAGEGRPPVDRARCRALLAQLAHGLHRFRIRTLDAFFVQLAGVFALELGLPPEWRILEEDELKVLQRETLTDALHGAAGPELIELLRALQRIDAGRAVERALLWTVDEARGAFIDAPPEAWDRVNVPEGLDDARLDLVLEALEHMPLPTTQAGKPAKRWADARDALLRAARAGAWEDTLGKGLLKAVAERGSQFDGRDVTAVHLAVLEPLLEHAAHRLLGALRRQNLASRDWLGRFEHAFARRKDAAAGLSFEDVPRALAPARGEALTRAFDLGYRLDGRIDHLLLDEFQDTAPAQWRVLAPLAEEIAADGSGAKTFFCVGDVKQSIYAWRSGEPRLLKRLGERFPSLPAPMALVENWRSSPVILDAVDRVFRGIGGSTAFGKNPAYARAAERFQADYLEHVAARPLPGAVALYEAPAPGEGASPDGPVLELAAERAAELARQAPHAAIALLLRRNAPIPWVIDLLRRRGLRASGEGGSPLTDSAAVLHALSALHLADHPGDRAAAFHVATSPLAEALGALEVDLRDPSALSAALRARLARGGFGELLAQLLPAVEAAPGYGPWDHRRFAQLVDLGYAFERREELRTTAFLDFVRETKVEDPSSTQIKVMTIHASKGLEFDAVILPELDLKMTVREANVLRARPDPEAELHGVSLARDHATCRLDPEGLGAIRDEEDERHVQEALCLFYVAMTRAAHRLELVVRPQGQRTPGLSYATVLREALLSAPSAPVEGVDGAGLLWLHPDSSTAWWPAPPPRGAPAAEPARRKPAFAPPTAPRELARKSPSAEEGGHALDVADLLRPRSDRAFARGRLVHRLLEEVEWLDAFGADDAALDALLAPLAPDPAARAEAVAAFRAALAGRELAALLARPAGETEVWRERAFAEIVSENGADILWTGSFDRVVLHRERGDLVRAEVIDFKTDRVDAAGVGARAAFYAPQLEGYRRVLARMADLPLPAVEGALAFLEPGVVRRFGG